MTISWEFEKFSLNGQISPIFARIFRHNPRNRLKILPRGTLIIFASQKPQNTSIVASLRSQILRIVICVANQSAKSRHCEKSHFGRLRGNPQARFCESQNLIKKFVILSERSERRISKKSSSRDSATPNRSNPNHANLKNK
ncbi:hypothetical protein [Helicobacter sp. 23-1045]